MEEDQSHVFLAHSKGLGEWSPARQINSGTWNTFYPMLATDDLSLYVAWTERKGESSQILLQTLPLAGR